MCGIAGIISTAQDGVRSALEGMVQAQKHRGPNDHGVEISTGGNFVLGLGQTRLSILDLSCAGHQPMVHAETGDQLVFNGEIYNFRALRKDLEAEGVRFEGHSDTEVLLHGLVRWGTACISRLQGMFAFAFYSREKRILILARDPLGIKPLYFAMAGGKFVFASETRAILASGLVPAKLDVQGMAGVLAYGTAQDPATFFHNVKSFPAGCWQSLRLERMFTEIADAPQPHWSFPAINRQAQEAESLLALQETMELAVRDHLVSDVPVGVFLSSGIDSTIVAGLASRHTPQLRTFTVGFADQPAFSESEAARRTAEIIGAQHTDIQITGGKAEEAAIEWLNSLDRPSFDGLNTYVISKAIRAEGITVALSGLGGDELFGGYPSFGDLPRIRKHLLRARHLGPALTRMLAHVAMMGRSEAFRQKLSDIMETDGEVLDLYFQRRRVMSNHQLRSLGVDAARLFLTDSFLPPEALRNVVVDPGDMTWTISQLESRFYMANMLLRDSDTNGMAHSLEIRVPMLDRRLLDLAFSLPGRIRLPDPRVKKPMLRKAFSSLLRPQLTMQAKRGFTLPIARWMVGPLREMCELAIHDLKKSELLRPAGIDEVWQTFLREPESAIWSRAFLLCVLGTYMRKMKVTG